MTPPGLCCIACTHPLYPSLARITSTGWLHVNCANMDTCASCNAAMIEQKAWRDLTPSARGTAINDGYRRKAAHGVCHRCYERDYGGEKGRARRDEYARVRAERLEDIQWMYDGGECLDGVAQRLGLTIRAVEHLLTRAGEPELLRTLTYRNPRDHNRTQDGSNITRAMPDAIVDRKNAKRNEVRKAARQKVAA